MDILGIPANDFYRTHARNMFATVTIVHHMWKTYTETQKYDFESILLNFVPSQFIRQVPMEDFMSEKVANEPVELLSKLLSFLNFHSDYRTSTDFME